MGRLTSLGRCAGRGLLGVGLAFIVGACATDTGDSTELNPEGPPMIRQVFVAENNFSMNDQGNIIIRRNSTALAFGDHPQIPLEDDDRMVTDALASNDQKIRIVLDELLRGNFLEEIACADGTWSTVPVGADPDDIAACAGPLEAVQATCTGEFAVCVGPDGPVGILDEDEDGAVDDTRLIDGVIQLNCGDQQVELDRQFTFWQPSGNQLIPASSGINGLGPALVIQPVTGLKTGAECSFTFADTVVDKDGNQICAPEGGDISLDCVPGDVSRVKFQVEALRLAGSDPQDGATNQAVTSAGSSDRTMLLQFNTDLDPATADAVDLLEGGTPVAGITREVQEDDGRLLVITVPGGLTENTDYTIEIPGGDITDLFGGELPETVTVDFSTGDAPDPPDAGPDADTTDADTTDADTTDADTTDA